MSPGGGGKRVHPLPYVHSRMWLEHIAFGFQIYVLLLCIFMFFFFPY